MNIDLSYDSFVGFVICFICFIKKFNIFSNTAIRKMSGRGKEMAETYCRLTDILKKCEHMYEQSRAMCDAACQQGKEVSYFCVGSFESYKLNYFFQMDICRIV